MDDPRLTGEPLCLPIKGPCKTQVDQFTDFIPLRLLSTQGGTALELHRHDMVIGRHSECDIRLPLPDVSRRHCRFVYEAGEWNVYDLNSLNGVFVNGEAISHSVLRQGDQVRIGGFHFVVELSRAVSAEMAEASENVLWSISRALPQQTQNLPPNRQAS